MEAVLRVARLSKMATSRFLLALVAQVCHAGDDARGRCCLLPSSASAYHMASGLAPMPAPRLATSALRMQEVDAVVEPITEDVETPMDMSATATPTTERFKAISLNALDEWGEKFPRLQPKLKDIKMSSLIFPFKASPYLVEELIDWEMEGDIQDDPFYRLVFPTMDMLSAEHRALLEDVCKDDDTDPFELKAVVERIREDLNPHPAGQKELNANKKGMEDLTGVQHKYAEVRTAAAAHPSSTAAAFAPQRVENWSQRRVCS